MTDEEDRILTLEAQVTSLELRLARVWNIATDMSALSVLTPVELKWLCVALLAVSEVKDD